jgi:putative hydrolase of the HAD superfamily
VLARPLDGFAIRREGWRHALASCGCADESIVKLAFGCLETLGRQARRLFPDAEQFPAGAAKAGTRLAIVTNGPSDFQRETLRGIEDRVDAVIISGEVGMAKPDPAIFLLATERLGVAPEDAWCVGDSLTHDVVGAQAAGMRGVWLNRGNVEVPLAISSASWIVARSWALGQPSEVVRPDPEIASLTELLSILSNPPGSL